MSDLRTALRTLAEASPAGSAVVVTVPREALLELLDANGVPSPDVSLVGGATWRERLWTCPAETRLSVPDVAEAVGRRRSWVYRAVSRLRHPLPARRMSGELVFVAEEVRAWLGREEAAT